MKDSLPASELLAAPIVAIVAVLLLLLGLGFTVVWILFPIRAIKRPDLLVAINKRISEHLSELNGRVSKLGAVEAVQPTRPSVDQPDDLPEGMAK